jgi:hypothetical protein
MESKPTSTTDDERTDERGTSFTRRALLRAGWLAPVVSTVNIPSAFAQSPVPPAHSDHTDHLDVPHTDVPHTDTHTDAPHSDHADEPHQDHQDHQDAHADAHGDTHTDVHADVPTPHGDAPHQDTLRRP